MYQKIIARFNAISFSIIIGICALLPVFFLPATVSGLGAMKGVLLYVGVFLAASFWLVAQFVQGSLKVFKHGVVLALLAWVAISLISALASKAPGVSLWGRGFAIDSFATTLVLSLFTYLVAMFASDQRRLVKLFLAAFIGATVTLLLQFFLYAFHTVPFVSTYLGHVAFQGSLIGSWVDFSYFVTLLFILALLVVEVLMPKGFFRVLSIAAMVLSLVSLIFLNFKTAWIVAVASALLVFVYKSSVERSLSKRLPRLEDEEDASADSASSRFPLMSFVSLLVGLFFLLSSNSIGVSLSRYTGISFTDIRPSFATTSQVMGSSLRRDPLFGPGAGLYSATWNQYRPQAINNTIFWNTPFEGGFNLVQSFATTNGALGTIAFLAVVILSLIQGFKLFSLKFPDRFSRFIAVASLIMLLALTMLFIFSYPSLVLIVIAFLYIGLLLGVSALVGRSSVVPLNYLRDPRLSFFSILVLVLASMAGFSAVYFSGNRFASIVLYNRALLASSAESAAVRLERAIGLAPSDMYWRTRAVLASNQFLAAAAAQTPDKTRLQNLFSQAEQSATAATAWDRNDTNNWVTLGQVYQLAVSKDATDAYTNAKRAFDEAQKLSPLNPFIRLAQAQLAAAKEDAQSAEMYIAQAIELKPDYRDAYVLRAQLKAARGDNAGAKADLGAYIQTAPYDVQGYQILGNLLIQNKEYQAGVDAYAQARDLAPNDPNGYAQYINALVAAGRRDDAIAALQALKQQFTSITGIDEQIERIRNQASTPVVQQTTETTETPEE